MVNATSPQAKKKTKANPTPSKKDPENKVSSQKTDVDQVAVNEAETEELALQYYYDNIWFENKNIFVEKENLDDSDEVLEVKQMK